MAIDVGVRLHPCQMTMDLYGLSTSDFIDGLQPTLGAPASSTWRPRPTSSCSSEITAELERSFDVHAAPANSAEAWPVHRIRRDSPAQSRSAASTRPL